MKKTNLTSTLIIAILAFLFSCSENNQEIIDDDITIIYERNNYLDKISNSIFDNHVIKIERIGQFNSVAKQLYKTDDWRIIQNLERKLYLFNLVFEDVRLINGIADKENSTYFRRKKTSHKTGYFLASS